MNKTCLTLLPVILGWNLHAQALPAPDAPRVAPAVALPALADLEHAFWACEHAASRSFVGASDAAVCAQTFETLRQRRFGGDFGQFMRWWQQNRRGMQESVRAADALPGGR